MWGLILLIFLGIGFVVWRLSASALGNPDGFVTGCFLFLLLTGFVASTLFAGVGGAFAFLMFVVTTSFIRKT